MKICLLLQRRFAYVGHAMVLTFKNRYGVKNFCAYVSVPSSLEFLKSQTEIKYSSLLSDEKLHEEYLKEPLNLNYIKYLENEYGIPNLWPYLENDRIVRYNLFVREYPHDTPDYSHEEMIRMLQVRGRAVIKFLEDERPDVVIIPVIADITSLFFYHVAKKKNIKILFIQTTRIGTRYTVSEHYGGLSYIEKTFDNLVSEKMQYPKEREAAEKFLAAFQKKPTPYAVTDTPKARPITRSKQFKFLLPNNIINSLYWFYKKFEDYFLNLNKEWRNYYTPKPWHYLLDRAKRKIRVLIGFDDLYDKTDLNEDYAFFPLQFEPEMSLTLFAKFYNDQLWVIKQAARSLPMNYKLYVKEHPAMFGYRTRYFYKQLKKIPNVKLINPQEFSFPLIQKAKLIITIAGSAGWEGVLLKKPVITFGNTFFNILPMVKKCLSIEDLPYLVKNQLENFQYDEKTLLNLLTAIYKESAEIDLIRIWDIEGGGQMEKNKQAIIPFVDYLAEKLNLKLLNK